MGMNVNLLLTNTPMKQLFRSLTLGLATVLGTAAVAQPLPPYDVTIVGMVPGCAPNALNYVTVTTVQNTQPAVDIEVPLDANCGFTITLSMESFNGWFQVSTPCNGAIQSATLPYEVNSFFPDSTYLFVTLNCGGSVVDCEGVMGGSALPGTACDDGDPTTSNDIWGANCICAGTDSTDVYDCLQILNGPNLPGTPCTNPATGVNGLWSANCVCVEDTTTLGDCEAGFWVMQAYTYGDSINNPNGGGTEPIPNEVWVWNLSNGGDGNYQFAWSFGDGTASTEAYPTHVYATGGPYQLCLTMTDGSGCTSTYCDDVTVDEDGLYTGLIVDGRPTLLRAGFTIRVISELPTAIAEREVVENLGLWPNPVEDVIGLSFNSPFSTNLTLTIFDLNGRVIRSTNNVVNAGDNRHSINVADLDAGMYLLQIANDKQSTSRRFVKR